MRSIGNRDAAHLDKGETLVKSDLLFVHNDTKRTWRIVPPTFATTDLRVMESAHPYVHCVKFTHPTKSFRGARIPQIVNRRPV